MPQQNRRFVFVVTYARSGSTLMQSLLNTAPEVQIRGENNNVLLHLFRACEAIRETATPNGSGEHSEPDSPWYGAGAIKAKAAVEDILERFVTSVLVPDQGKTVIGFKEIRHIPYYLDNLEFEKYMKFLLAEFPDARIVFNSRDAVSVSKSAWLAQENSSRVMDDVQRTDKRFVDFTAKSDRAIHMRYEQYVADHKLIVKMFDFLKIKADAAAIERVFAKDLTHSKEAI